MMKKLLKIIYGFLFICSGIQVNSQTNIFSFETFPNAFNTNFSAPVNTNFTGSTGAWQAYSNNNKSTIVVNSAYSQSAPYALKIVNYSTGNKESYGYATSPKANLSSLGCLNSMALTFRLYTYSLSVNNPNFSLTIEFSDDNGSTWTSFWMRNGSELIQSFGAATWATINIPIPTSYQTSDFKYRIKGYQNKNCGYNSYLYIDDICILTQPCLTTCSSGFNLNNSALGFNVFTKSGVTFNNGHIDGAVATAGSLTLSGASTIATNSATLKYPVTSPKFGLVVGENINYTSGNQSYVNNGKVRIGNSTGSRFFL
jgi:hypothetical protein